MPCSDARLTANRANAQKSTGPKTAEGRDISKRNSMKHGLSGLGAVIPEADQAEVEARAEALEREMNPTTTNGALLVRRMALLSVRMERAGFQESAHLALRSRHAADDFDEARLDEAALLFNNLHEDPRTNLRKLRKSPEGVTRLIDGWRDLLEDLTANPTKPHWTASQMERAALMSGTRTEHSRDGRIGVLSRAVWGDFERLSEAEGGGLTEKARQNWARGKLRERIEAEIADLQAHQETLDLEGIAIDRAEAGHRALFDASKPATLARRYESEAARGFYKALKEFRQIEAEAEVLAEAAPPAPPSDEPRPSVGSTRVAIPSPPQDDSWETIQAEIAEITAAKAAARAQFTVGRPPQPGR